MAATWDAVGSAGTVTIGASPASPAGATFTHTPVGTPTMALVAVPLGSNASVDNTMTVSVTYGGVTMTSKGKHHSGSDADTAGFLEVFALGNPPAGPQSVVVTITYSSTVPTNVEVICVTVVGSSTNHTALTITHAEGKNIDPTATTAGSAVGSLMVCFVGNGAAVTTAVGGTNRAINTQAGANAAVCCAASTTAGTGAGVTMGYTGGTDWFAEMIVEVPQAPGPGVAYAKASLFSEIQRPGVFTARPVLPRVANPVSALGSITLGGMANPPAAYIVGLKSLSGTSYFIDQFGNPRMVLGDEAWALLFNAGRWGGTYQSVIDDYMANRAAQGFTVLYFKPLASRNFNGNDNGSTWDGVTPFVTGTDPSSGLNNTFWTRVDYLLSSAAAQGITVFFNVAVSDDAGTNYGGSAMDSKTTTQWSDYGTALGNRYKTIPNLVWLIGDDGIDDFGSGSNIWNAFLTGLRATGDTHVFTPQYYPETTSRKDLNGGASLTVGTASGQFQQVYSYEVGYYGIEEAYKEASPITVIHGDGYFFGVLGGGTPDAQFSRQLTWHALSSGARGFIWGSEGIWQWGAASAAAVTGETWYANTPGDIRAAFEALPGWWRLLPDTSSQLVTAGRGTRATFTTAQYSNTPNTDSYVTASRTADGTLAVIYMSHGSTITIDESKMVAGYTATWVDPITGATSAATPGSTYNSTAKGNNSAGDPDWVLVLQGQGAAAVVYPSPGGNRFSEIRVPGRISARPQLPQVVATVAATATGSLSLDGTVTAQAPVTATGSLTLGGAATAQAPATATGSLTLAGTAAWVAPTASGSLTLGGAVSGVASTATGSITLGGTAAWTSPTISGSITLGGTAAWIAQAAGSITLGGSVTAAAPATATGSITLAGFVTVGNVALGSITLAGTVTAAVPATAAGTLVLAGTATAKAPASALGTLILAGTAQLQAQATALGLLTLAGLATARAAAGAVGSITLAGTSSAGTPSTAPSGKFAITQANSGWSIGQGTSGWHMIPA